MSKKSARTRKGVSVRIGKTEITKLGVSRFDRHDLYHLILSLSWPRFFAGAIVLYLCVNLVFATAYFLGDHAITNAHPGSFSDCFFFSVETLATVGYGYMSPGTIYGHTVATVEILSGMLSLAVITSLVFARFSKPTARVLFSKIAVVAPFNGVPTLILRVANQRQSYILEAAATLTLIRDEITSEGHEFRRFHELKLERQRSPLFMLTWSIMHRIDENSPLYGMNAQQLAAVDARLALTLTGVDETFAAGITARYDYSSDEILFGHRFADVLADGDREDHYYIHMDRLNEIEVVQLTD